MNAADLDTVVEQGADMGTFEVLSLLIHGPLFLQNRLFASYLQFSCQFDSVQVW
jgi:hypothetical protein